MPSYTFLETLRRLLADPALATKNSLFDPALLALYLARVDGLTPDVVSWYTASDVVMSGDDVPTGSLVPDVTTSRIELETDGFEFTLSRYRDGLQTTPRKIRRRVPGAALFTTPADRVRYVLADPTDGVLLLDQNMEIVRTFPGLVPSATAITGALYKSAQCAAVGTITIGSTPTELMFIACGEEHCVQIVNYATGASIATIGTADTAGLPTGTPVRLTDPVSVAVDDESNRLYIACRSGNVSPDTGNAGFVAEFDITTPGSPTFVGYVLQGKGLYRLNNMECRRPSDVFFVPASGSPLGRLWVANGLGDVAAFERTATTDPWQSTLVIEALGPNYVLGPDTVELPANEYAENAIDLLTGADTHTRLSVAVSRLGLVEVFRASSTSTATRFGKHEATYGQRGIENTMPFNTPLRVHSSPLQPKLTFGVFSEASGVVTDETILPGETLATPVMVVADADAGRLQRLRLPIYSSANTITFAAVRSVAAAHVVGWFLPPDANFPAEYLTVEVRDPGDSTAVPSVTTGAWREVPRSGFSTPVQGLSMTRYQFRVRATLPRTAPIEPYWFGAVGIILRQSW